VEEMICGALGPVSARKNGMMGRGLRHDRSTERGSGGGGLAGHGMWCGGGRGSAPVAFESSRGGQRSGGAGGGRVGKRGW
jgi:hypothetical protein